MFSPDGRMLALTLGRDQGNLDIYMLDLATQILTRLTQHSAIDTEAVWAPDGESIYFTSDRAGGPQVYRVEARYGARVQRITYEGSYNARPRIRRTVIASPWCTKTGQLPYRPGRPGYRVDAGVE